jgi:hypothetical protein
MHEQFTLGDIKIGILVNPIQDNTQKIETLRNRDGIRGGTILIRRKL